MPERSDEEASKERGTRTITMRVPTFQHDLLKVLAQRDQVTFSQIMRRAISSHISIEAGADPAFAEIVAASARQEVDNSVKAVAEALGEQAVAALLNPELDQPPGA